MKSGFRSENGIHVGGETGIVRGAKHFHPEFQGIGPNGAHGLICLLQLLRRRRRAETILDPVRQRPVPVHGRSRRQAPPSNHGQNDGARKDAQRQNQPSDVHSAAPSLTHGAVCQFRLMLRFGLSHYSSKIALEYDITIQCSATREKAARKVAACCRQPWLIRFEFSLDSTARLRVERKKGTVLP
jgi:hypothetical protein